MLLNQKVNPMSLETKSIRVKFFGSLREFGDAKTAEIVINTAPSVKELRSALFNHLMQSHPGSKATEILKDSAFADERSVLSPDATLEGRSWIAVLPPVCGG